MIIKTSNIGPWLELFSIGLNEDLTFGKIYTEKHVEGKTLWQSCLNEKCKKVSLTFVFSSTKNN